MVKSIGLFITGALLTFSQASGTTVSTTPTGYFPVTIAAGTSAGRTLSFVSFPLQNVAPINGEAQGFVTGVTSNTITNSNAGWTAGQLSTAATPCLVQFTSGAAAGRTFLVSTSTSNTATTLTLDAVDATTVDLTTLGIVPGTDTYQILSGDTLSTLFGTPATTGIAGATSSGSADQVELLSNGVWLSYYYNTNSGWLRVGPPIVSANVVIRPDTGVIYSRLAQSALSIQLAGYIPTSQRQAIVANSGVNVLSASFPISVPLLASNIQGIPGWVSGPASTADRVLLYTNSVWISYYNNGTNWVRSGPGINSNSVLIPAGSAAELIKTAAGSGFTTLTEPRPYSL